MGGLDMVCRMVRVAGVSAVEDGGSRANEDHTHPQRHDLCEIDDLAGSERL